MPDPITRDPNGPLTHISPQELKRREGEEIARLRQAKVLRESWNLPERFKATAPERIGPWGETLIGIQEKLGSGFTVALIGNRGSGKTQLAAELMKVVTENGRMAYYTTATGFFMRVKASYGTEESELDVINAFRKPRLLVIDEAGKQPEKEWHSNLMFELLNARYGDMTDTILIDNRTKKELEAASGDSLVSRIRETGGVIDCNWPSFRK